MRVNNVKAFSQLSQGDKERIVNAFRKDVEETTDRNFAKLQKIWMQYACIILHDKLGLSKEQCLFFLGHWREMYKTNAKFDTENTQSEYLRSRMDSIFGDDYPYKFIDKLERIQ